MGVACAGVAMTLGRVQWHLLLAFVLAFIFGAPLQKATILVAQEADPWDSPCNEVTVPLLHLRDLPGGQL
jgi:hypothetical protein